MHVFQLLLFSSFSALIVGTSGPFDGLNHHLHIRNATSPVPKIRAATVANLQTFTGKLGGVEAPAIVMSNVQERPFSVQGDTFPDFQTAAARTCDRQHTGCITAANNDGTGRGKRTRQNKDNLTMKQCDDQLAACNTAQKNAPFQTFSLENLGPDPASPEFDLLCAP